MEAIHLTLSNQSADRIGLLYEVAIRNGSLITPGEIARLLPEGVSEGEVVEAIASSPSLRSRFELRSGYIAERAGKANGLPALSLEAINRRRASANIIFARRFAPYLRAPTLLIVAVSGSTSYRSAAKSTDLDLFCVTDTSTMWVSLSKALLLARFYRLTHRGSPQICLSCVMDWSFATRTFASWQSALFSRDALEAVVLKGEPAYEHLLREGYWIAKHYPRMYRERSRHIARASGHRRFASSFDRVVNLLLVNSVGRWIALKSKLLNLSLSKKDCPEELFQVLMGKDHLIYESIRYKSLRRDYSASPGTSSEVR